MEGKRRSQIITVSSFLIVFMLMLVALKYGGNGRSDGTFSISGIVTDDMGDPISNATVFWYGLDNEHKVNTDDSGQYSFQMRMDELYYGINLVAKKDGYWRHAGHINYANDTYDYSFNFSLSRKIDLKVPICPVVLATTIDSGTRIQKITCINDIFDIFLFLEPYRDTNGGFSYSGTYMRTFSETVEGTSLSYATIDITVGGAYQTAGEINKETVYGDLIGDANDTQSTYRVDYFEMDYLEPENVSAMSFFYALGQGESMTIKLTQFNETWFPSAFSSASSIDVIGKNVTLLMNSGVRSASAGNAIASVTITALTEGTHHYQVYIENELVIHVWEIDV